MFDVLHSYWGKAAVVEPACPTAAAAAAGSTLLRRCLSPHPPPPFYPVNYSSTLANERVEDRPLIKAIK